MRPRITSGVNGLPKVVLSRRDGGSAELYLHGAHLTSWIPAAASEVLFLSRRSLFASGTAIRGGIPVIFPQFADRGPLPKHGFARTSEWWLADRVGPSSEPDAHATLRLRESDASWALWPHPFVAELSATLEERALHVRLTITNTGEQPFSFTSALHSYFRVHDVRRATVRGLRGTRYVVSAEPAVEHVDDGEEMAVAGEVDRVYRDAPPTAIVDDRGGNRLIQSHTTGFADVVVWNPWGAKARALPDMAADEYLDMLCIEAAQVAHPVVLAPEATWTGEQHLSV